jgi:hypothetical protein
MATLTRYSPGMNCSLNFKLQEPITFKIRLDLS